MGGKPTVYVMNMDRSPERMSRMKRLLDHLGIPFVRVPAVDGRTVEVAPTGIAAGTYGNFLSHIKCWEMIAAGAEPAGLCLEDDVVFSRNFAELWADKRLFSLADVLRIEGQNKLTVGKRKALLSGGYSAHPLLSQGVGSAAYIVTRAGANWLLENAKPVNNIDLVIFGELLNKGIEILTLVPAPCAQYLQVVGLPADPALNSTLDVTATLPRKRTSNFQSAIYHVRQQVEMALYGKARVAPALHPSGPLVL
jgi:glycosyl transferase family 25